MRSIGAPDAPTPRRKMLYYIIMALKKYNITFIIILVLIIVFLWWFSFTKNTYDYYNINQRTLIEGAATDILGSYNINTEFNATPNLLLLDNIKLQKHWGLSFTIKINSIKDDWQQIIGITPDKNGADKRFFMASLCPNSNNLFLRTATVSSWDENIISCEENIGVPIGQDIRIDVIATINQSDQNIAVYTTNLKSNENPRQIKNINIDLPNYSTAQGTNKLYAYTSYKNNTNTIDGIIRNVVFVSSTNNQIELADLRNAINKLASGEYIQPFTTMTPVELSSSTNPPIVPGLISDELPKVWLGGSQQPPRQQSDGLLDNKSGLQFSYISPYAAVAGVTKEGLTNIGGLGNKTTSDISSSSIQNASGYTPIVDDNNNPICAKSIVQSTDLSNNLNYIRQYGYNYPLEFGSNGATKSVPICSPDDLYLIQKQILKKLNKFNQEYTNLMTYAYNTKHNVRGDDVSKLSYVKEEYDANIDPTNNNIDTKINDKYSRYVSNSDNDYYVNLNGTSGLTSYNDLVTSLTTYNNLLFANKTYYSDPEDPSNNRTRLSNIDPEILGNMHQNIIKERSDLDAKLFELNNIQNSIAGESKITMDSSVYVTILMTTLATSILYYVFTQ